MKVFLAGATGAIGKRLLPQLVAAGHIERARLAYRARRMQFGGSGRGPKSSTRWMKRKLSMRSAVRSPK